MQLGTGWLTPPVQPPVVNQHSLLGSAARAPFHPRLIGKADLDMAVIDRCQLTEFPLARMSRIRGEPVVVESLSD
jgi:hypothetical protein